MNELDSAGYRFSSPLRTQHRNRHRISARSAELWHRAPLAGVGPERLARGLAWFSIALGLAELLAPRMVAATYGGRGRHTSFLRLAGLREIAAGLLIFVGGKRPAAGLWARVGGDLIDLATLGAAALSPRTNRRTLAFAAANVLGVAALDLMCAQEISRKQGTLTDDGAVRVIRSILVNVPAEEAYGFWRELENLPRFMRHLHSVEALGPQRSRWVASAPGGSSVEWEAEIVADRPGELLAWRSVEGSQVENAGTVRFEPRPGGRGTIVRVELEYRPPGGIAAAAIATVFDQAAQQQLHDDLHRFKQVLETGEVLRSDGSPDGIGSIRQRPGRPQHALGKPFELAANDEATGAR